MKELKLTKDNFEAEVMKAEQPVLIDFWAGWCGPCRMIGPAIAELADEYEGRAKVCKVNVDEEPELAAAFQVSSIPLVVVVKDGRIVDQVVGVRPKKKLEKMLAGAMA